MAERINDRTVFTGSNPVRVDQRPFVTGNRPPTNTSGLPGLHRADHWADGSTHASQLGRDPMEEGYRRSVALQTLMTSRAYKSLEPDVQSALRRLINDPEGAAMIAVIVDQGGLDLNGATSYLSRSATDYRQIEDEKAIQHGFWCQAALNLSRAPGFDAWQMKNGGWALNSLLGSARSEAWRAPSVQQLQEVLSSKTPDLEKLVPISNEIARVYTEKWRNEPLFRLSHAQGWNELSPAVQHLAEGVLQRPDSGDAQQLDLAAGTSSSPAPRRSGDPDPRAWMDVLAQAIVSSLRNPPMSRDERAEVNRFLARHKQPYGI